MMENILGGLALVLQPMSIMWLMFGLIIGFVVGVLPGLSSSSTAALLLPFAIGLPFEVSLILIVSIYAGAQFAGAIPAILLNVPGESGSAVTALDGYPLMKQGKGGYAIGIARMASTLGGVISGILVLAVLNPLGTLALQFGAREMFVVILLGFGAAASMVGPSVRKGVLAGCLGLIIATIGASPLTGQSRFTFDTVELYDGIALIPALIGAFAVSEMLMLISSRRRTKILDEGADDLGGPVKQIKDALAGAKATFVRPGAVGQSTIIGILLGVIPGIGTAVANFLSYGIAKRRSKHPEEYGKGSEEGIIASEACDNAVATATLVPTLTLGIPGSATMAIVLAAFFLNGVQPGPRVLVSHPFEVYSVVLAMIIASILILPLGIALTAPLVTIAKVPLPYLVPVVLVVCFAGAFAARMSLFDVGIAVVFGLLAYLMRLHGYPVVPMILGMILGPLAEENLMRALALGNNSFFYFFDSPVVNTLWGLLAVLIAYLVLGGRKKNGRKKRDKGGANGTTETVDDTATTEKADTR